MESIKEAISRAAQALFNVKTDVILTRTDEQFGDYATNVALQLAGRLQKKPKEIAEKLAEKLRDSLAGQVSEISVAGPGFINFKLTDKTLLNELAKIDEHYGQNQRYKDKVVVAEYSDPNPFKVLHAGHIYTTVVGDAIAHLLEAAGATVHRVNYGGDVGLHVGKTMWAIVKRLGGEQPERLANIPERERSEWLASAYVEGNRAYENDEKTKQEVAALNKRIYDIQAKQDHTSTLAEIYWTTRQWSYEAFDAFYARFGTKLEKYYPESEVAELGLKTVREHIGKVFEESQGAVIFRGEQHGLHTRVFISSEGLPTYEAKEVGLIIKKQQDYNFDLSFVITGNEQQEYMRVVLKAIEQILPKLTAATTYIPHGMVKLAGGVKMSSRKGNIVTADDVLDVTAAANKKLSGKDQPEVILGAVKYAFLKQAVGPDIIYDPEESVAIQGSSGPYLQYAYTRAKSILNKAQSPKPKAQVQGLEAAERSLARKISEYPEVVIKAVEELMPHHIATYLYELAQAFNHFYEHNRVIGDPRQELRLQLVQAYAHTLKKGLDILNIPSPENM